MEAVATLLRTVAAERTPVARVAPPVARLKGLDVLAAWHLLSLDAPTVAALWTWFIARVSGVALNWRSPAAMFLAVWMLYALDRLLDGRGIGASDLERRHVFHQQHRRLFTAFLFLASALLLPLVLTLPRAGLELYAVLGLLLAVWFLVIHLIPKANPARLPKEFATGFFFSAALFIPTIARAPWLRLSLLPAALLFALLCVLNCLFIYTWEHEPTATHAHTVTQLALRALEPLTLVCAVAPLLLLRQHAWPIPLAISLAAMLLLLLHHTRHRLSRVHLRAAADLVLLTPLLLLASLPR